VKSMEPGGMKVGLARCPDYDRRRIKTEVEDLCSPLGFRPSPGAKVLLKPNLVAARRAELACTHPEVVAAVAEWFLDHGCAVAVGDSPAFGTARRVMRLAGIQRALSGLPVRFADFSRTVKVGLASGGAVGVAAEALECDILCNLPRLKAHSQLLVTLAVKNLFGCVVGFRKPWLHARLGKEPGRFAMMLVDLLAVLPCRLTVVDGIIAMDRTGPVDGDPFPLGLLGAATDPVAMDTALLTLLGIPLEQSPVWAECARRGFKSADPAGLAYVRRGPSGFPKARDFSVPRRLEPISFHPVHLLRGAMKRVATRLS